jgi:hypothetical protein
MQAGLPSKEHAPVVAANLARRGVNCIRFHFLDRLAPWLVSPKTNSPSPAQRSVQAGVQKAIPYQSAQNASFFGLATNWALRLYSTAERLRMNGL